jgi:hypothetical protein
VFDEEAVNSSGFLELVVAAQLDNLPLRDDCNDVSLLDGAQPVSYNKYCPVLADLASWLETSF